MYCRCHSVPPFCFLHFVSHVGRDWGSGAMSVALGGYPLAMVHPTNIMGDCPRLAAMSGRALLLQRGAPFSAHAFPKYRNRGFCLL